MGRSGCCSSYFNRIWQWKIEVIKSGFCNSAGANLPCSSSINLVSTRRKCVFFCFFFKKYCLTCSLVFFSPQMENSDSPSVFAAKKILVLHYPYDCTNQYWDIQFMLSVQRGIVCPRGGQHTSPLFNHFLKQNIKARTKNSIITKAPHENVKWLRGDEFQEYISYCRIRRPTGLHHWFSDFYLFIYFI